jgi:pyruvate ferredoxin oxidoreductase gamma subunit
MKKIIEIRWHGRGGQGTVTAAKVFAEACLHSGRYVQAFPEYGPERSGAPLHAYNRISNRELRQHCPVLNPHIVVVVDATLLDKTDVTVGTFDDAFFLINSSAPPDEIRKKIATRTGQKLYCVDASRIAMETIGKALPNSPLVGALTRISALAEFYPLIRDVEKSFGKKFTREVVMGNIEGLKKGWEEVKQI